MKTINKNVGIWLDTRKAYIMTIDNNGEELETITSDVDESTPKGGYGKVPFHQQDARSEKHHLERKKQQTDDYFEAIMDRIEDAEQILLLGPAETRIHLGKKISGSHRIKGMIVDNLALDSLSENQILAEIRNYFSAEKVNG